MKKNNLLQELNIVAPSAETIIQPDWKAPHDLTLTVKRDDLLHPIISGNKWRKLKHALIPALEANTKHIISFGGGFSNHLHALGYCCHKLNMKFTAIVRGDYSNNLSPMLQDLINWKSTIHYVDRKTYQQRTDPDFLKQLQQQNPSVLFIPEGGTQLEALRGVAEIIAELNHAFDYIFAPVASGGTLAGLITGIEQFPTHRGCKIMGIAVLKGEVYLEKLVSDLLEKDEQTNWQIDHHYHFGGYAKFNNELTQFCSDFYHQTAIEIEPVYSGKLFFALRDLIKKGYFPPKSRILALHTGGLQGAR